MKSYDKILFQNDIATEEFVITILRDETIEGLVVEKENVGEMPENERINLGNEGVNENSEGVNQDSEGVNDTFEGVNQDSEGVNQDNEGVNENSEGVKLKIEGVKDKLNQELGTIYDFIKKNPLVKTAPIEQFSKKSNATIERYLKILKDNNLIEYVGSDKTGGYRIINKLNK
jgi:hypothetical protein